MQPPMVLFETLFIVVALLIVSMALPLMRRRVKPNRLYGLRTSATVADEWVWYEANARTGRDFFVLGLIQLAVAVLPPLLFPLAGDVYVFLNAGLLAVGAVVVSLVGGIRAHYLLKQRQRGDGRGAV